MHYDAQGFVSARDGTKIFYGAAGSGPALVLLDGIGCAGFVWERVHPWFTQAYRVIHWNYRGHGRSGAPKDAARIRIVDHAEDLERVLDALEIADAAVIGHSMGTQVALELVRAAPARVRALVLACGSYGRITSTFHGSNVLDQILPALLDFSQRNRALVRAFWGRMPAKLGFRIAKAVREIDELAHREEDFVEYLEHVATMDPDLFFGMLKAAGEHSAEDMLASITIPTLVVAAERDTFTPPELAAHMASTIPGAEHFVLRGGSHAAPVEQPEAFFGAVEAFLGRARR